MAYFFITILSFYTNTLLARFHMLNGRRNIRFRDLARSGFGASCSAASANLHLELSQSQPCTLQKSGAAAP